MLLPHFLKGAPHDGPFPADGELEEMFSKGIIKWKPTKPPVPCIPLFEKEVYGFQYPMGGGGELCVDISGLSKNTSLQCIIGGKGSKRRICSSYLSEDRTKFYCTIPSSRVQAVYRLKIETIPTAKGVDRAGEHITYSILMRSFENDFDKLHLCAGQALILKQDWMNFDLFALENPSLKPDWGSPEHVNNHPSKTVVWDVEDGLGFIRTHSIKQLVIGYSLQYLNPSQLDFLCKEMARVLIPQKGIIRIHQASNTKYRRIIYETLSNANFQLVDMGAFRTHTGEPAVLPVLQPDCLNCIKSLIKERWDLYRDWNEITLKCWICHVDYSKIEKLDMQHQEHRSTHNMHYANYYYDNVLDEQRLIYGNDEYFHWALEGGVGQSIADIELPPIVNMFHVWPDRNSSSISLDIEEAMKKGSKKSNFEYYLKLA